MSDIPARSPFDPGYLPRMGEKVVYVTPNGKRRLGISVDDATSPHADLTIFTHGNIDHDWLQGNEGPSRDIRNQARLVVRRGSVPYDRDKGKNTWHWFGDE